MASIYKRGNVWWVKYYRPGSRKPIRASLDTSNDREAVKKLKILEGELAKGNAIDIRAERIRFGYLLDLVLADYANNARKSEMHAKSRIEGADGKGGHIRPYFGDRRALTINSADISLYVASRREAGASNGTINRELTLIKRAFTLGWRAHRLPGPHIELLEEHNVRSGFVDRGQLESLCRHLPDFLKPVARFAFLTGWRIGEIRQLEWRHVDFVAGEIRLDPGTTKNNKGRVFKMTAELRRLLEALQPTLGAISADVSGKNVTAVTPRVFTYTVGGKKTPKRILPIGDHGKLWAKACKAAGLPGRIFHDLRRSAVRQFVRDGIPERVAMQMTGHQTRDVFDRYHIVSESDLDEARTKTEAGTSAGTKAKRATGKG